MSLQGPVRGFIDAEAKPEYRRLCAAIFLAAACNHQSVVLPLVWSQAGFSKEEIGLLFAIYGLPLVVLSFFSGAISHRLGHLGTARVGVLFTLTGLLSFLFTAESYVGSILSRLMQGVGFGLFLSPVMAYGASRLTSERFVHLFSLLSSMAPLPQAIAPVYGELLLRTYGEQAMLVIGAMPAVLSLPLLWSLRPDRRDGLQTGMLSGYGVVLREPRIVLPLLCNVAFGTVFGFVTAFFALYLETKALSIGTFFTSYTLVLFAVRFGLLGLVEQVDRRLIIASGVVLIGLGMALATTAQTSPTMILAGIVFGFGHATGFPIISTWLGELLPPETRGVSLSISNTVFFMASLGSPVPVSLALARFGYEPVMLTLTVLCWCLAVVLIGACLRTRAS